MNIEHVQLNKLKLVKNHNWEERKFWISETASLLERSFGQVLGLTRAWSTQKIKRHYQEAMSEEGHKWKRIKWWKMKNDPEKSDSDNSQEKSR